MLVLVVRVETKDSMKDGTKDQISDKAPHGRVMGRLISEFYSPSIRVTKISQGQMGVVHFSSDG